MMQQEWNSFTLKTGEKKKLKELGCSKIYLRKIKSNSSDINTLFSPIQIKAEYPDNSTYERSFIATFYFSNTSPLIETDKPMEELISHCEFSTMWINADLLKYHGGSKEFILTLYYEPVINLIDDLIILVTQQSEGNTYSLHPNSKVEIKQKFSKTLRTGNIFVSHETKFAFQMQHGSLLTHIEKAITELSDSEYNKIRRIVYVDAKTNNKIHEKIL